MAHGSEDIRNLALVGHGHSGKTALIDALAHHLELTSRLGSSAEGTSISDVEPEEKERKHTLTSHLFRMEHGGHVLNVFDTPGHNDFMGSAIAAMDVVETVVLVVNATSPLTFHARQLWQAAGDIGVGRAIVVTHLDHDNTDFDRTLAELREAFGHAVVPVTYPDGTAKDFKTALNVLKREGPHGEEYHEQIEEDEAEVDDTLMEHYLESGHLEDDEFEANLRRAIAGGKLAPVFAINPLSPLGLRKFLAFVSEHFPSPVCFGARGAGKPGAESFGELCEPAADAPFAAKVFKIVSDPYVGRMSYLRCLRGSLSRDSAVKVARDGQSLKFAHIFQVHGKETNEIDKVVAGDLFAVSKIEGLEYGDTVFADGGDIAFPKPNFPLPTYSRHIWPKSRGDEQKIGSAVEKVVLEDPTLQYGRDPETGEFLLTGMSPLHLDVQFARMHERYQVDVEHGPPTIPYRETIMAPAEGHHRHKKQSGGRGQFAEVYLRIAPREHGAGFEFVDSIVGGAIPRQFIPEVEKGALKFTEKGALAGFQVVDLRVEVHDGKFHDVDSDQLSFQLAGQRAVHDGYLKAKPILLEPIMDVEIHVPERFTGDVAGNLSSARGRMSGMEIENGIQTIKAQVPLASMLDYSTQLRSITAGEGTFSMQFSSYEAVPPNVQNDIVAQRKAVVEQAHAEK